LVGAFPNDAGLYQDSPVRGASGSAFVIALPAAVVLGGVTLHRSGWRGAGVWSLVAGIIMAWATVLATALSAIAGTHQPQLSGAIILQALASAWYLGLGVWLLLVSWGGVGRISDGRPALRFLRLVGAGLAVLSAAGLAGSAVLAGVILGPTTLAHVTGRTQIATLTQGKVTRSYRVYRPAVVAAQPGLVIVLHGALGDGYQAEVTSGFDIEADRLGWIVAYPDGVADGWEPFGCCQHLGVDDVAFIAALIDRLEATDRLDPNRVYATGFSRGGMMSYRIGCELPSRVAAIAPVAGNMATITGSALAVPCRPDRPVSVLAIHGTADPIVHVEGGLTDIIYAPLGEVMLKWRELDLCADSSAVSVSGPSTTTTWHCSQGSTVAMRVVSGGGHAWPKKGIIGSNSPDRSFDASAVIADFFLAHSKAAPA
jgi:polyhydroxybutyrate depolymerase